MHRFPDRERSAGSFQSVNAVRHFKSFRPSPSLVSYRFPIPIAAFFLFTRLTMSRALSNERKRRNMILVVVFELVKQSTNSGESDSTANDNVGGIIIV